MARIYPDISYGFTQKQQVDIHEPEDYNFVNQSGPDPKGVVIYLHGGGWAAGDKADGPLMPPCLGGGDDKAQCSIMADQGWVVISANYDLLGPDPDPDPCPALAPRGDGYAPENILQIARLIRFLAIPGYATGANQATWELMNRYVLTRGLMVTGGSAGGHLAIAGAFQAADDTGGYWPRGMLTFVGPMDIFPSPENPVSPFGQSIIDAYTLSSEAKQKEASPYWRRDDYATYPGFNLLADPDQRQVKTHVTFWYNTNDTLTPDTSILRFRDWALDQLGPGYALTTAVTEGVPDPDSHNITTSISGAVLPMTNQVFYQGLNYPNVQQKLRPTQGMVYPRPLIYRYPRSE